jgi:serine phosphatase RsbU (regulator of sigma subunit)
MEKNHEQIFSLDGLWRFHPGDDPHWADPNFDDSQWPLISSTKGWSEQGYKNMSGLAWYRARIVIPEGGQPLALYIPHIDTSYQVFIDGQMIGQFGGMPPHERAYFFLARSFRFPERAIGHAHAVSIAIRVWHWPVWAKYFGGGLRRGMLVGHPDLIGDYSTLKTDQIEQETTSLIIMVVLEILAALTALALFAFRPREKEYLWFGAAQIAAAAITVLNVASYLYPNSMAAHDIAGCFGASVATLLTIGFYFCLLDARRDWFLWLAVGGILGQCVLDVWVYATWPISVATLNIWLQLALLPSTLWIDILVIRRAVKGYPDARLVLFPQLASDLWGLVIAGIAVAMQLGRYNARFDLNHAWQVPFPVTIGDILGLLYMLAILAILVRRFTRTSLHEERMAGEMEAARAVQHVLIPEEIPAVPGFAIEAVYKPASEVGGDFFQIVPVPNGGLLAAIGDVSGKGMPAAMTVSLLVGTVRTLAHYTQDPGEILTAMNERMLGRSEGGFTTCLVLHVEANGSLTVANAGHLPPYLDGAELEIENGFPLGLAEKSTYPNSTFQLAPDARLTLMTDGVAEARNRAGELFGFERARKIAAHSPESVASEAQAFGQQDDITVLTLALTPVPVLHAVP